MEFRIGEYVTRRSYNSDILFRIEKIIGNVAILRSLRHRLLADAPLKDLVKYKDGDKKTIHHELKKESFDALRRLQRNIVLHEKQTRNNGYYHEMPIQVLHIDGDEEFLKLSVQNYENLGLNVKGFFIPEKGQPEKILDYLESFKPDILVITGHDGFLNGKIHRTSDYFIKAVEIARDYESNLDELIIFAGACQSDYEKLITSGANFASSPERKMIHFMDPILVVEKVAFTSIREVIQVKEIVKNTITGEGGVGGVETRGKLRLSYP